MMGQPVMVMMTNVVDAASVGEAKKRRRMAEEKTAGEQERKTEEKEEVGEVKLRLFVGGLGPSVSISDLEQRFAPLGSVHRIEMIPSKAGVDSAAVAGAHRGFAYVEFEASSQASLRKLFSAYNGCKWKGGSLRVEKAKEHYMDRLRREWAAAQAKETSNEDYLSAVSNTLGGDAMNKQSKLSTTNLSFMQSEPLKIAMASSKKVKLIPAKGSGKHKRSFQYFPSLPLNDLSREIPLQSPSKLSKLDQSEGVQFFSEGLMQQQLDEFIDEHANVGIAIEAAEERKRQLKLLSKLFPDDEPKEEPVPQPEAASGTEKQLGPKNGVDNEHTKIRVPKTKLSVQPKLVSKPTTVPTGSDDNVPIDEDKVDSEEDPWMQGDDSIFFQSQSPSPLGAASDASKWSRLFKAASVKKSSSHSQSREGVFSGILDDFDKDDSAGPVAEPASLDPHLSGSLDVDSTPKPSFEQCSSPQTGANTENTLPGLKPGSMGSDALIDKQDLGTDEAVDGDDYSAEESNDEDEDEGVDENEEDSDVDENGDDYDEDDYDDVANDDVDEDPNEREDDDDDAEDVDKEDENEEDEDEDEDGDGEEGEDEEWATDVKVVSEANPLNGVPPRKMPQPAKGMGVTSSISQSAKSCVREIEGKNNKVSVETDKSKIVTDPKIHGETDTKWVPKSSWNSLICPDVHPNFSLQNLTGSMKPDKGSTHGKTLIKHLGKATQSPEGSKSRKVLGEKRHRSGGVEGARSEAKKRSDGSSFLKSTVAEGERVASKSELQVEIKVKHKVAVPSSKKLGGPGSARK